jgi:hypothetical protein
VERGSAGQRPVTGSGATGTQSTPWSEQVRAIGGLLAVGTGVLGVVVIALVALSKGTQQAGTIAASTAGVIAAIVGAYFGVKIGSDQTKSAVEGERRQAAKATVLAAHIDPARADDVLAVAEATAKGQPPPEPPAPAPAATRSG